jgi:hypothetical protein
MDCLRGRFGPSDRCKGGSVEDRPGGEVFIKDGKISRCRWMLDEKGSLVMSLADICKGGNSIDVLGIRWPSMSE